MALFAESIKDSCSFTPNPVLVALSQKPSRYLPPKATLADAVLVKHFGNKLVKNFAIALKWCTI